MSKGGAADRMRGGKPLYGRIRGSLLERIGRREWGPGEVLPNEAELARQFDASVGTIRKAIEGLEASGVIVRRQGLGTFVSEVGTGALERRFMPLVATDGRRPLLDYAVHRLVERSATASEAARLGCDPGQPVLSVMQHVSAKGAHVGIETSVMPAAPLSTLKPHLAKGCNLYAALAAAGLLAHWADDRIHVRAADGETASRLDIRSGEPLLFLERTTFDIGDEVIELRSACYVPRQVAYSAVV